MRPDLMISLMSQTGMSCILLVRRKSLALTYPSTSDISRAVMFNPSGS
jgi:hypothetical protein